MLLTVAYLARGEGGTYTFADVAESTKHNSSAVVQANANRQGNNLKFKKGEFRNQAQGVIL